MATEERPAGRAGRGRDVSDAELEAVLGVCRVLVAVSAQSIAAVEAVADPTQVRILVIIASRGAASLGRVAEAAALHISKASRVCERMVRAGLLDRADDPHDRRQLVLSLTGEGRRVVRTVRARRQADISRILAQMPGRRRATLVAALSDFADAAGEPHAAALWSMGWTSEP